MLPDVDWARLAALKVVPSTHARAMKILECAFTLDLLLWHDAIDVSRVVGTKHGTPRSRRRLGCHENERVP
jgi:hypothetical protein